MSRERRYRRRLLARISTFTVILAATVLGAGAAALATTVQVTNLELRLDAGLGEQNTILLAGVSPDEGADVELKERTAGLTLLGCTPSGARAICAGGDFEQIIADLKDGQDFLSARETTPIQHPLTVRAGSGNDTVRGGDDPNNLDGGPGDDLVVGGLAPDVLHGDQGLMRALGGAGSDSLGGGPENDRLFARDGVADNSINCGAGSADRADVDLLDQQTVNGRGRIAFCENITAGAVEEGPNVRIRGRSLTVSRRGRVAVRLSCPRAVSEGCAGVLTLAGVKGRRSAELVGRRYRRIRAGRTASVKLRLSRSDLRRAGAFARVRVTSVEKGEFGDKTTIATLELRLPR